MDRTSLRRPARGARQRPFRSDSCRRRSPPDISDRYSLGGWPTTAFLTADGDLIGGGTYMTVERMPSMLERVAEAFTAAAPELTAAGAAPRPAPRDHRRTAIFAQIFADVRSRARRFWRRTEVSADITYRARAGALSRRCDETMGQIVEATLDAMGWGGLYDDVDGGFFRYALRATGRSRTREVARRQRQPAADCTLTHRRRCDIARYRRACRRRPSLRADLACRSRRRRLVIIAGADRDYYAAALEARRPDGAADRRRALCSANARMVSAALRAAELLDDYGAWRLCAEVARAVRRRLLQARGGHRPLPRRDGRRSAASSTIRSRWPPRILDAHDATGNIVYEMMAQELAHYAVRVMWDDQGGGFFDRVVADAGEARRPDARAASSLSSPIATAARTAERALRRPRRSRFRRAVPRRRSPHGGRAAPGPAGPLAAALLPAPCAAPDGLDKLSDPMTPASVSAAAQHRHRAPHRFHPIDDAKRAAVTRRPACPRPTSSRRCSSARCASTR